MWVMWTGLSFKETEKDYNAAKLKRLDQSPLLRCSLTRNSSSILTLFAIEDNSRTIFVPDAAFLTRLVGGSMTHSKMQ